LTVDSQFALETKSHEHDGGGQRFSDSDDLQERLSPSPVLGMSMANHGRTASVSSFSSIAAVRDVYLRTPPCEVFHWRERTWHAVEQDCLVEVRQTTAGRSCIAVLLEENTQMYLNAWILPTTIIKRDAMTDVSIGVEIGQKKEHYLIHFDVPPHADALYDALIAVRAEATEGPVELPANFVSRSTSLGIDQEGEAIPTQQQQLQPLVQCRCKIYLQNDVSSWTNLGGEGLRLSLQLPSRANHLYLESEKNRTCLMNGVILPEFMGKLGPKRISIVVKDGKGLSTVYMIQIKDEQIATKLFEIVKGKKDPRTSR